MKITPFIIAVDTREQHPFTFGRRLFEREKYVMVWTQTKTLKTGDYSIVGHEDKIAVERKSLMDLFGTLGQNRERFEREFHRMAAMDFAAVVVEGDFEKVLRPHEIDPMWPSKLHPHSVIGTIQSWQLKYKNVHWWLCPDRRAAEQMTFGILEKYFRYFINAKQTK